jgi:hypothetical protein
MPEERPSDSLPFLPALLLLSACDSHAAVLNWSRSLVLKIRRIAAVAPGLVLRILLISPRKSVNSSSQMARHVGHLDRTCRTVIVPSSHAQRRFHTPGTLLSYRKFENPIFPVRSCVSSALCAFVLPAWRWRFACVGSGVNLYSSLPFELSCHLFFHFSSALSLIFVFLVLGSVWRVSSRFSSACLSLVLPLRHAGVSEVVSHGARGEPLVFSCGASVIWGLSHSSFLCPSVFLVFASFPRLERICCLILFMNFPTTSFACDSLRRSMVFATCVSRRMSIGMVCVSISKASVAVAL